MFQKNNSNGKIFKYFDRINILHSDSGVIPICVEIHLTMLCQQKCKYCTFKNRILTPNLDFFLLKNFLFDLSKNGCKSILWSGGGEPSLYNNSNFTLSDVIKYTNDLGLKQGLYTNGENLTSEMMKEIVLNCTFVRISLDAFTAKTYKKIHGSNKYNKIISNIKTLINLKKNFNSNINIGISFVVYKENTFDIILTKKFLNEIKPDYIYFRIGTYNNKNNMYIRLQHKILKKINNSNLKNTTQIEYSEVKTKQLLNNKKRSYETCYTANLFPTISTNGNIYVCCHHIQNPDYIIGNIYRDKVTDIFSKIYKCHNFSTCPPNCRGDIMNKNIKDYYDLINNPHSDFL